ncbi:SemiSWEET family transporter [Mangrovivirga cuniculi]
MIKLLGILTLVASWSLKLLGFPGQIRKLIKTKNSDSLSLLLFSISFISYVLWTTYGILKNDYVIYLGQGVGILASGITIVYIIKYRNTKEK